MPAFRDIFNLEFVLSGNEKNRGQDLNSRFCLLSHLWIFDWTKVKDPKHSTPYCRFCQAIYQDQIKLYETFQNLATFNQVTNQTKERQICKKTFSQITFQFPWPRFSDIIKITQSPPAICFTIAPSQEYFEVFEIFLFQ